MDWNISRRQFYADFFIVPIYVVCALALAIFDTSPLRAIFCFGFGWAVWTLTEYAMHRWVFHLIYRREHAAHHKFPTRMIGVMPSITGFAFFAVWLFLVQFFHGIGAGSAAFAGFAVGYYVYIGVHLLIHHSTSPIVAKLRATHEMHHEGSDGNFGVSTNFWDHIFGTYLTPRFVS